MNPERQKSKESSEAPRESKEGSKFEYLRSDIKPIMACVGKPADFKDYPGPTVVFNKNNPYNINLDFSKSNSTNAQHVDYFGDPKKMSEEGSRNQGEYSYVISRINNQDKFSNKFKNCTGLLVAGKDKNTGENISFLSHEDPDYFLSSEESRQKFMSDLKKRLEEIKERSADRTIDARIVGGNYFTDKGDWSRDKIDKFAKHYLESIELLAAETSGVLGFEPIVVMGPKTKSGQDDVFYDNENRRLYIVRTVADAAISESFVPKEIKDQEKKWLQI